MKRKSIVYALLLVLVLTAFVGCKPDNSSPNAKFIGTWESKEKDITETPYLILEIYDHYLTLKEEIVGIQLEGKYLYDITSTEIKFYDWQDVKKTNEAFKIAYTWEGNNLKVVYTDSLGIKTTYTLVKK